MDERDESEDLAASKNGKLQSNLSLSFAMQLIFELKRTGNYDKKC